MTVDPVSGYRIYTPVNLVVVDATPLPNGPATSSQSIPTRVDVYNEDVQNSIRGGVMNADDVEDMANAALPLGSQLDEGKWWAPFTYTFRFKKRLWSRDFYVHRSHVCIDNVATAKPRSSSSPVKYTVSLFDDHGSFGIVVGAIRFTANKGWLGYCFDHVDTSNRYYLFFSQPDNNDGYISGQGSVDYD